MTKQKVIEVLPPGTRVKINEDINAIIIAISIRGANLAISYECQWTTDEVLRAWIDEIMVKPLYNVKTQKIGFEANRNQKQKVLFN